jgi:DNA-binding sugar fermentation-stimulating protein
MHEDIDVIKYKHEEYKERNPQDKIALFPVSEKGIKALKGEPLSPRAVKHVQEMAELLTKKQIDSATLLFIITRSDVAKFKISANDKQYLAAVQEAVKTGVSVRAVAIEWLDCSAYFHRELEIEM